MNHFILNVILLILPSVLAGNKIKIDSFKQCEDKEYPIKYDVELKTEGDQQYIESGKLTSKLPLNETTSATINIYLLKEDKYELLGTINEPYCKAIKDYFDEFESALRKASGLDPNVCKIDPGEYSVKHFPLDPNHVKLPNLPAGKMKLHTVYSNGKNVLTCFETVLALE